MGHMRHMRYIKHPIRNSHKASKFLIALLLCIIFLHRNSDLLNLVDGEVGGSTEWSNDGLGVKTLLHVRLELFQELCCKKSDRGGAVPNLRKFKINKRIKRLWTPPANFGWSFQTKNHNQLDKTDWNPHIHLKKQKKPKTITLLASASWERAMSTRVLAAGWTTSSSFRMVAPSLEIVALPRKQKSQNINKEKKKNN